MTIYQAPHEVRDTEKLKHMIETLNNGGKLPAVVVIGEFALTGSHRLAAWKACGLSPSVVEISNDEYVAACEMEYGNVVTIDEIYDYSEFCDALYITTENDVVKNALEDQR